MSKYRSREAPLPGTSVSETHHGWWRDCIRHEDQRREQWYENYGHLYERPPPDKEQNGVSQGQPMAYLNFLLKSDRLSHERPRVSTVKSTATPLDGRIPHLGHTSSSTAAGSKTLYESVEGFSPVQGKVPVCDYSVPGNWRHHHVVCDPSTTYSASFGHHRSPAYPPLKSAHHFSYAQVPDTVCGNSHFVSQEPNRSQTSPYGACQPFSSPAYICYPATQRSSNFPCETLANSPVDPELCPKCRHSGGCVCVPRRRERVPDDGKYRPQDLLTSWPPQPWAENLYCGSHSPTSGDIWHSRYQLAEDNASPLTPGSWMCNEMQRIDFYGSDAFYNGPD